MYKRIMIVVDEGAVARAALNEGLQLARIHGAEVVLFHVLPNYVFPIADAPPMVYMSPEQHKKDVERLAARLLASASGEAARMGLKVVSAIGSNADAATCIAEAATERHCDLIVVGSHGRNAMQRLIFGSVVTRLITFAAAPVLVCKPAERVRNAQGRNANVSEASAREAVQASDAA
jgi:nucleotide-binding universal stress UspA family protein